MSSVDHRYYFGPTKLVKKRLRLEKKDFRDRWDFQIEEDFHSKRFFVSKILKTSNSYLKGLRLNDEILSINRIELNSQISLKSIEEILSNCFILDLIVLNVENDRIELNSYRWFNPIEERSTSPPPSNYLSPNVHLTYPERIVKMDVDRRRKLGLVIRGGKEFRLGIFISGIDRGSLSEQKGLLVGDQILSVNGIDFRHINHQNAVEILRKSSQLTIHLRQMNKLPQPTLNSSSSQVNRSNFDEKFSLNISNPTEKQIFEIQLEKYLKKTICLDEFLTNLSTLIDQFDFKAKKDFLENLRQILHSNDRDHFEIYLLKEDLNQLKKCHWDLFHQCELSSSTKGKSRSLGEIRFDENDRIRRPSSLEFNAKENLFDEKHFQMDFDEDQQKILDEFLHDYSSPYRLTIHKVRPTLGIAIEGGKSDRIPLPRIVYIQPDGSAYLSSRLRVGDVLLSLNDLSFVGLSHRQCALMIASAFKDSQRSTMDFLVVKPKSN